MTLTTSPTRADFDARARTLVGRRVARVVYFELVTAGPAPGAAGWNQLSDRFDSLDFGLEIFFEDGTSMPIAWGWEFFPYGVSLPEEPITYGDLTAEWDATSRWSSFVGATIAGADVYWCSAYGGSGFYPQDLRLRFENEQVVTISAYEQREPGPGSAMMDHITVFFDDQDVAERMLGPYGLDVV